MDTFYHESEQSKIKIIINTSSFRDKPTDTIEYSPTSGEYFFDYEVSKYCDKENKWKRVQMSFSDKKIFVRFLDRHYYTERWIWDLSFNLNGCRYRLEEICKDRKQFSEFLEELLDYITVSRIKYL